jgi:DNA sulfur modification protein DndC
MVHNDTEKSWMQPLVHFRNLLDNPLAKPKEERPGTGPDDREVRDFRRMGGLVQIYQRKMDDSDERVPDYIPGPYLQKHRLRLLREVLIAQEALRKNKRAPEHVRESQLITVAELREIRRIWVLEKHETEDFVPVIYEEVTGEHFPDPASLESSPWGMEEFKVLQETCENELQYQLLRELLHVEQRYRTAARRAGLYESLEGALKRSFYEDEDDAVSRARRRHEALSEASVIVGGMAQ